MRPVNQVSVKIVCVCVGGVGVAGSDCKEHLKSATIAEENPTA